VLIIFDEAGRQQGLNADHDDVAITEESQVTSA
jgi:hypothetical protein